MYVVHHWYCPYFVLNVYLWPQHIHDHLRRWIEQLETEIYNPTQRSVVGQDYNYYFLTARTP